MCFEFPYFEDRPHVPVSLINGTQRIRVLPLLDSGADFSIFYKSDAIRLGLDWESGDETTFNNADGNSFLVKKFKISIEIEGVVIFPAEIFFMENAKNSMPLLGRKGVFEHFEIVIREKEKVVELRQNQITDS